MTNRDFDQSDAETLADFAGLEVIDDSGEGGGPVWVEIDDDDIWDEYRVSGTTWFGPWLWMAPRWQTQLLKDAVREKGKTSLFLVHLRKELDQWGLREDKSMHEVSDHNDMELVSAPPEAICSSVLEIIPEGSSSE